mgnify:CR=1 FL=1
MPEQLPLSDLIERLAGDGPLDEAFVPVDAAIVGIVDALEIDRRRQARPLGGR